MTSDRATARSAWPAGDPELVLALPGDGDALHLGADDDEALGLGLGRPGLVDERGQAADDVRDALAGHGRDPQGGPGRRRVGDVGLRPDHEAGPLEQLGPVGGELVQQDPLLLLGRRPVDRGEVEQEAQHPGPLDVAEELMAEALALAGPLDQAGDVGHHELGVVVEADHAEVRARAW